MWLNVSNRMIARLYFLWVYIPNKRTQESGHLTPISGPYVSRWLGVYQVVQPSFRNALRIVSSSFQTTRGDKTGMRSNNTDVPTVRCSFFKFAHYISPPLPQEPLLESSRQLACAGITQGDWTLGSTIPIKTQRDGLSPGEMVQSKMRPI